jgi:hypothetical protein
MTVYMLEARIAYEGSTVLGVYSSRAAAHTAARAYEMNNLANPHPTDYQYLVYEIVVDAAPSDRFFEGEQLEVE